MLTGSVVRPKTPRGTGLAVSQTGRTKVAGHIVRPKTRRDRTEAGLLIQDRLGALVVGPKLPKGRELALRRVVPASFFGSSDPKPRGDETSPSPSSDISSSLRVVRPKT